VEYSRPTIGGIVAAEGNNNKYAPKASLAGGNARYCFIKNP
jgi:hypothetical protein